MSDNKAIAIVLVSLFAMVAVMITALYASDAYANTHQSVPCQERK